MPTFCAHFLRGATRTKNVFIDFSADLTVEQCVLKKHSDNLIDFSANLTVELIDIICVCFKIFGQF
jgi:hypothetical protein